ncbi:sce7726 family protein [Pseudomonas mosselii]|uniref:sce7726 family protein n=1 Tax=Pseudomonas mosselii TaxID=78327 RepID=UPI002DB824E2|nr:sce7726 family protein [Pseudomonas mosselii]MEB5931595.1 sce7726 family protein [Pseudomonas mosselii]
MSLERKIKAVVLTELIKTKHIDYSTLVFSEMTLAGKVRRVDLGYSRDGAFVGIEIKSENDSLVRLVGQVEEYTKYFDKLILVVAPKFVSSALLMSDSAVAIWEYAEDKIRVIRKGRLNYKIPKSNYVELMTKREIAQLVKAAGANPEGLALYDLKLLVNEKCIGKLSRESVKAVFLGGIEKRYGPASKRFLGKVRAFGKVGEADLVLLSPYARNLSDN